MAPTENRFVIESPPGEVLERFDAIASKQRWKAKDADKRTRSYRAGMALTSWHRDVTLSVVSTGPGTAAHLALKSWKSPDPHGAKVLADTARRLGALA